MTPHTPTFSDFNSIIYGHHMDKDAMFGPLDKYSDATFFDSHPTGTLFFNRADHGIEFFAFLHTSAYNHTIFTPNIYDGTAQQNYLDEILTQATHTRPLTTPVTTNDRLVLSTTCSGTTTNGRDLLVGRVLDHPIPDPFADDDTNRGTGADEQKPWWAAVPIPVTLSAMVFLTGLFLLAARHRKQKKPQTGKQKDTVHGHPGTTAIPQVKDNDI